MAVFWISSSCWESKEVENALAIGFLPARTPRRCGPERMGNEDEVALGWEVGERAATELALQACKDPGKHC